MRGRQGSRRPVHVSLVARQVQRGIAGATFAGPLFQLRALQLRALRCRSARPRSSGSGWHLRAVPQRQPKGPQQRMARQSGRPQPALRLPPLARPEMPGPKLQMLAGLAGLVQLAGRLPGPAKILRHLLLQRPPRAKACHLRPCPAQSSVPAGWQKDWHQGSYLPSQQEACQMTAITATNPTAPASYHRSWLVILLGLAPDRQSGGFAFGCVIGSCDGAIEQL